MEVKIERATIKDIREIQKLNLLLFKKEKTEYNPTLNLAWIISKQGKDYFAEALTSDSACTFLAKINDRTVGYLVGAKKKKDSARLLNSQAELCNMFILEEFRNKKIGTELVRFFFQWAKSKNIKNICVSVTSQNLKAMDFYRKIGFKNYQNILEINLE